MALPDIPVIPTAPFHPPPFPSDATQMSMHVSVARGGRQGEEGLLQ